MSSRFVWMITGCSSGVGRELTIAALARGDRVIATTRGVSFKSSEDLQRRGAHTMELDVTASLDELKTIASQAVRVYGQVDVVVNNAGFYVAGSLEETTHQDTLDQFNTNLFGAINVTRAFLPYMRERRTGTVAFIGSRQGWRGFPFGGLYAATKYALRGISDSLHLEISPFGLRSICFNLGSFRTAVISNRQRWTSSIDDYNKAGKLVDATIQGYANGARGDPVVGSARIVDVIRGEGLAFGKEFPTNVSLGEDSYKFVETSCEEALACSKEWRELSLSTDFCSSCR